MRAIEVSGLTKIFRGYKRREGVLGNVKDLFHREYQEFTAVNSLSLSVEKGELLGYIGPNGAGKSTSIKMLTGILMPTSGEMNVLGFHPFRERQAYTQKIGVVFGQRTQLWWDIAVKESFRLLAKIYRVGGKEFARRLDSLSEVLELKDLLLTPVRKLSLGQRMRCDLAASLLHEPEILFLDEPTIGLDAVAKDSIRRFLRHINDERKTTILLTTHDLKEIEELCDRIVVLDKGKLLYDGPLERIKLLPGLLRSLRLEFPGEAPLEELNALFTEHVSFEREGERRIVSHYDPHRVSTSELLRVILESFHPNDLSVAEPNIEEVIMKLYRDGVSEIS